MSIVNAKEIMVEALKGGYAVGAFNITDLLQFEAVIDAAVGATLPRHLVLIVAERDGAPVAASLNVRVASRLCGRYWGALQHHDALHFETCYYQGIDYCIARGIATFEGGSRGEHKLARGFLPVEIVSAHWLAHPEFAAAVGQFLAREAQGMERYVDELADRSPYKQPQVTDK